MSMLLIRFMFVDIEENGANDIDNARHSLFVKVKRDLEKLPPSITYQSTISKYQTIKLRYVRASD